MVAACASLVKVLRTRKSVPASPVVPPLVPARPSFAAANFRRGEVPPHHRNTAELQLRRTPHHLDPEAAPHLIITFYIDIKTECNYNSSV